jgi:hypothetical protein
MSMNNGSPATEAGAAGACMTAGVGPAPCSGLNEAIQSMAEKATASQDMRSSRKKRHWSAMTWRRLFDKPGFVNADLRKP